MAIHRCNKLKKEMEAAQKKEAEDTAAMEKMLGEVEANLLTTTVNKETKQYYSIKEKLNEHVLNKGSIVIILCTNM